MAVYMMCSPLPQLKISRTLSSLTLAVHPVSLRKAQDSPGEQRPLEDMTVVPQFQVKVRKGTFSIFLIFLL